METNVENRQSSRNDGNIMLAVRSLQVKYDELCKEIKRLQEKYDENGYDLPPMIQLKRIENYIDSTLSIYAKNFCRKEEPAAYSREAESLIPSPFDHMLGSSPQSESEPESPSFGGYGGGDGGGAGASGSWDSGGDSGGGDGGGGGE